VRVDLRNLFLRASALTDQAVRYSLLLRDFEVARKSVLATDPSDPLLLMNMARVPMRGVQRDEESLELTSRRLVWRGDVDEAINALLMGDKWEIGVSKTDSADGSPCRKNAAE
jgi:hypothetical protein